MQGTIHSGCARGSGAPAAAAAAAPIGPKVAGRSGLRESSRSMLVRKRTAMSVSRSPDCVHALEVFNKNTIYCADYVTTTTWH